MNPTVHTKTYIYTAFKGIDTQQMTNLTIQPQDFLLFQTRLQAGCSVVKSKKIIEKTDGWFNKPKINKKRKASLNYQNQLHGWSIYEVPNNYFLT